MALDEKVASLVSETIVTSGRDEAVSGFVAETIIFRLPGTARAISSLVSETIVTDKLGQQVPALIPETIITDVLNHRTSSLISETIITRAPPTYSTGHIIGRAILNGVGPSKPTTPVPLPPPQFYEQTKFIPAYLYVEYNDDDNVQALVASYNQYGQKYLDWFNAANIPVYTQQTGALLDWVAQGLYGFIRPNLFTYASRNIGPYNTVTFNSLPFNAYQIVSEGGSYIVDDDIFKRVITWNFYKGDGHVFNIRWLKRRVMRFLFSANGSSYDIDETYPVSVTFGAPGNVTIRFVSGDRIVTDGAILNAFAFNSQPFNALDSYFVPSPVPIPALAPTFKEAVDSGTLQLPFQYQWSVVLT